MTYQLKYTLCQGTGKCTFVVALKGEGEQQEWKSQQLFVATVTSGVPGTDLLRQSLPVKDDCLP